MKKQQIDGAKILIADDEPANVLLLRRLLEQNGFTHIETVTDARQILGLLDTFAPDILLLDIQMPYLDGFDVMNLIGERSSAEDSVPILVLTADTTVQTKRRALAAGADDFVTKPFDALEVILRVSNLLYARSLHRQIRHHNQCLEVTVAERTEQIQHQAFHDALTGLPNRALFMNRLELAHARAQRSGTPTAVLFLDIDNFKTVNDSLGHEAGDQLLHAVAERLQVCIRLGDTVARLGGDEFTILMEAVNCVADPIAVAERIKGELSSRFHVGSKELYATASIGIAFQTGASETFDSLLRNADAAMYEAKANGKSGYMLFDHSMNDHAAERLDLEVGLRFALERGELALKYQPLIDLETGDMVGAEALLRWNHPTRGEIAPGKFISIAEDTGLIVPIGYWVLEEACRQVARWTHGRSEFASFTMNINVSGKQLQRPDIVDRIRDILAETGANPANVKLEITETVMMTDMEANIERLHRLKTLGVKLAMDDFGTGYSCMANLDAFPLDTVKIDRAFIQRLTQSNEDSGQMVEAIIALSRALHLDVTGEGVETQHQMAQLRGLGCDTAQGFFFARPLTADALGNLIAAGPGVLEEARKAAESVSPETQARAA